VIALAAPGARFQPVYVGDVAHCFVHSVDDDLTELARYDLCGPKVYTLRELVAYVGEVTGAVRPILALGPALSQLQATVLEHLPGKLMSRDNLKSMQKDNVCDGPFPAVFGLSPTEVEAVAPQYLAPTARRSPYDTYRESSGR
jgi:NADH dehydrogenase